MQNTPSIDVSNAHGGLGAYPGPRPSEGRLPLSSRSTPRIGPSFNPVPGTVASTRVGKGVVFLGRGGPRLCWASKAFARRRTLPSNGKSPPRRRRRPLSRGGLDWRRRRFYRRRRRCSLDLSRETPTRSGRTDFRWSGLVSLLPRSSRPARHGRTPGLEDRLSFFSLNRKKIEREERNRYGPLSTTVILKRIKERFFPIGFRLLNKTLTDLRSDEITR